MVKTFNTDQLNGKNGFKIISSAPFFGGSVGGAGDVNNDGLADLIVGAPNDLVVQGDKGSAFVIFGTKKFPSIVDTSNINGKNGFYIMTTDYHSVFPTAFLGTAVTGVGDINNDSIDDVMVTNANSQASAAFIVYGTKSFLSEIDVSKLNGTDGFKIIAPPNWFNFGRSAAKAGDVNKDSIADIIIGSAWHASVIFGAKNFPAVFQAYLNGTNGFHIEALQLPDDFGWSVSNLGDVNGDGYDDVIVGENTSNSAYVVFGGDDFSHIVTVNPFLLNGKNGFHLASPATQFGFSVSGAIDVNGDGYNDIIIGSPNVISTPSTAFVIFGAKKFPSLVDTSTLDGTNGFKITSSSLSFGWSVSGIGDFNNDSIDDMVISAVKYDQKVDTAVYMIYGAKKFPSIIDTSALDGTNGFKITSSSANFGLAVAGAGDVNGDRCDDLIVGAPYSNTSFVIFGQEHFFDDEVIL